MDLKDLSSNWKKLQKTLQKDSPKSHAPNQTPNPLKRKKSSNEHHTAAPQNGVKRAKPAFLPSSKKRKMEPSTTPISPSALTNDDDTTTLLTPSLHHPDIPNAGLSPTTTASKYIALDCEMVGIGPAPSLLSQLARVSLVNYHGHQLYDSYVQPVFPVTDYRTPISGITPRHLCADGGARPFAVVQEEVAALLQDRVLVGHALRHDLAALQLGHPRWHVRDTARYPGFRALSAGRTPALRELAERVLRVRIQSGMHSSVEDARAAMALFRGEKEGFEREAVRLFGRPRGRVKGKGEGGGGGGGEGEGGRGGRRGGGGGEEEKEEEEEEKGKEVREGVKWMLYGEQKCYGTGSEVRDFAEPERLVNGPTA
jgi:RNA exonuclease 4